MTKNIMSIAAAAALLMSGASAFETNATGNLTTIKGTPAAYIGGGNGNSNPSPLIEQNKGQFGDALIFPAFNAYDTWSTEIVVRNNKPYAVVAKLVAYSAADSQELRDFNLYLSANDVFRCTINNVGGADTRTSNITSNDASVSLGGPWGDPVSIDVPEDTGYVIVYAMGAATQITDHATEAAPHAPKIALKSLYEAALTQARPGWNDSSKTFLQDGVFIQKQGYDSNITSPRVTEANLTAVDINLTSPDPDTLSGTVRMFSADEPRDLILPATAISNYTDGNATIDGVGELMLWAPRELAAFADRNIVDVIGSYSTYHAGAIGLPGVVGDASQFTTGAAYYTFNNDNMDASVASTDLANKLIISQPEKRTVVQLGHGNDFWTDNGACPGQALDDEAQSVINGTKYSLVFTGTLWNEEELKYTVTEGVPPETSPGSDQSTSPDVRCTEIAEIANLEDASAGSSLDLTEKNGYGYVEFDKAVPAIVTQMTASQVGDQRRINWVEAPVVSNN